MGKAISKFFFLMEYLSTANYEPYCQSMIDTITEEGLGIKGPTGYQIGNAYLEEKV